MESLGAASPRRVWLKQFLYHPSMQEGQVGLEPRRVASLRVPLGIINVIFVTSGRIGFRPSRVMFVARPPAEDSGHKPKRARMEV